MKVILVERTHSSESSQLGELVALAETLEYEVVDRLKQRRKPDPTYQIGKGKVMELAELVESREAEMIIFVNPLKPSQAFKLEEKVQVRVIDRFQLILEIFAMRAGSPEANLQVEYARLNYELPRVKERIKRAKLDEFPGLRGGGEYGERARVDAIKGKMKTLEEKLESLEQARERRRKRRREKGFNLVTLAGYTNAGKSTLLNALSSADVEVDDRLFTTLSPRTRVLEGSSNNILVTDTVGFIDDLPPWLIEAFKAALEEAYLADLVLLVVDSSESFQEILRKFRTSKEILDESSAEIVVVLNKIDLVSDNSLKRKMDAIRRIYPDTVAISAKEGLNTEELRRLIFSTLLEKIHARVIVHGGDGFEKVLHEIYERAKVEEVEYESPTQVTFWSNEENLGKIRKFLDDEMRIETIGDST